MMFSRALLVALCIVYATSLAPISAPGDDDCALYLTGPGRSSAYDYSLNLLKGNFAYDGQHTCITYEAINQAYHDARNRILVSQPKGDWKAEDFASVGELILDISISLARTYGLTYEEIEKGLPLIDTSRTLIREVCPPVFSHVECRAGKYRRFDGLCNNLRHPTWGATMAPFQRLIGPLFSDGINAPRISHTGHDLPLSRVVSRTMHPDDGFHDHAGTVMVIAWGQFMDHDYTLTGTPLDPIHRNDPEECCKRPPHLKHPYCNEIRVPDDDYFYRLFGVKCIDFVRGFPSPRPGCRLGSRVPFNTLTGAIDGNTVYGVTEKFARKLRTGYGGLLRMNPVFKEYGLKDLLPLKLDIPDEGCTRPNKNMYCFEAGEIRVNEQLVLTVMHTLMAREHNRVAEALAAVNPHWDDESLFQEARRINIAEIQHITFNEFLPILLGKDVMEKFGLVLAKEGYWDGYDPEVNPDVIASFASAAYRFGHSLLPTAVERWSKAHKFIASKRLSDLIRRPYDLYRAGVLDEYVMGLMNQVAQAMDDSITQEVTNHLFKKVGARFGMDLVSFNMQRGREFGIPGYMEFRKFCGLSGADTFQDLFGSMPNETIRKYETIFEHPIDVDLWSGGVSERPLSGSMLGPTFACIIATQFSYSRRGDRFWFELPNQPSSFTPEQLVEIRKSRLARIICDNTDIIDTVQLYPMVLPDHELNPRVPCRSGVIPSMDFSKWADPVPFLGGAKEYMTGANIYNISRNPNNLMGKKCDNLDNITSTCSNIGTISQNKSDDIVPITLTIENKGENVELCKNNKNNTNCVKEYNKNNCNMSENCITEISDQNKENIVPVEDSNTILKYFNKKSVNIKVVEKSKGHMKNSLKRRRRSLKGNDENIKKLLLHDDFNDNDQAISPINKYQIVERKDLNLQNYDPDGIMKTSNLENFEVETLHKNSNPHHSKSPRGLSNKKYYSPINNNPYGPQAREGEDSNSANISYEGEKYDKFEKDENISNSNKRLNTAVRKRKQEYHDDINNKAYLSIKEQLNEDSEQEIENPSLKEEEDNYNDEILIKKVKPSNNILQRGNLRYYKDRKKKYHISRPNLHGNNVGSLSRKNVDEEKTTIKNDSYEDDQEKELTKKERFHQNNKQSKKQRKKQKFHDGKKLEYEDNLSNQDENDEDDSHENYKDPEDLRTLKKSNNILRGQNKGYNNKKYNDHSEPLSKYSDPKNAEHFEREDGEKGDDFENDEDDDDDNDDENNEDFKHTGISEYKQTPYSVLQQQNQKYYNDIKNNLRLPDSKRLGEKTGGSYDRKDLIKVREYENRGEDEVPVERLNKNRMSHKSEHPSINNLQKPNQVYHNDKKSNYVSSKSKQFEEDNNENLEKEDTHENKNYEKDREAVTQNLKVDRSFQKIENDAPLQSARIANIRAENDHKSETTEFANDHNSIKSSDKLNFLNTPATKNRNQHSLSDDRSKYGSYSNLNSNSNEESIKIKKKENESLDDNYKESPTLLEAPSKSEDIQKADLADFSYERFKAPSEEKIEPFKNLQRDYESDTHTKTFSTIEPNIDKKNYDSNKPKNNKKPKEFEGEAQEDDDVVKTIVELNQRNTNKRRKNESTANRNSNLSDFLPNAVNYIEKEPTLNADEKINVKQQFERIPLNYNHADNIKTKISPSTKNGKSDAKPHEKNNFDENLNFKYTPGANVYDENLKNKFGDINIELPEIKLPEDVLIYAKEDESIENNTQPDYYNYDSENVEQFSEKPKIKDNVKNIYVPKDESLNFEKSLSKADKADGDYDFFSSYINKPHETNYDVAKNNNENSNSEDLYEKFVRERFGRKNSFKERSEKLQEKKNPVNKPKNQELFETLQRAIKKAEEVQKEAEKSGDPDASYLWTLEYGEKL